MVDHLSMILIKGISIVLVFGLAVFVHEFGHMFFAIIRGVGVESFAIGMGPKILSWKWRGIDFSLRWFPVGGFVKLAGLMPGEHAEDSEGDDEGPEARAYTPAEQTNSIEMRLEREETIEMLEPVEGKTLAESSYDDLMALSNKGLLTKLLVFGGGVTMNYLTAIVAMALLLALPQDHLKIPAKIFKIEEQSPAYAAGLRPGDQIAAVNGRPVQYSYEIDKTIDDIVADAGMADKSKEELSSYTLTLGIMRSAEGTSAALQSVPIAVGHLYINDPITWSLPPLIGRLGLEQPAKKAGLKEGDRIVGVDGHPVNDFNEIRALIQDNLGKEIKVEYERDGQRHVAAMTPSTDARDPSKGVVGIESGSVERVKSPGLPVLKAIRHAPGATWTALKSLVELHINFFKKATFRQIGEGLGGPILIARMTADAADKGLSDLVNFFITLNLLLMVFNLLPLPVLDGGFILISIIEAIIRRPVPAKVLAPIYTGFMFFFIFLMVLITFLDVKKWIS